MGCDITIFIQVFNSAICKWETVNEKMQVVPDEDIPVWAEPADAPTGEEDDDEKQDRYDVLRDAYWEKTNSLGFQVSRTYLLFAKLADVRNEYGLLNVYQPRGYPADLGSSMKSLIDDLHPHTKTWLSEREIQDLDIQEFPQHGYSFFVHADEYGGRHDPFEGQLQQVVGIIYTEEQWNSFTEERKKKELGREKQYGERHNRVYVLISRMQKVAHGSGFDELKELVGKVGVAFPDRRARFLMSFGD